MRVCDKHPDRPPSDTIHFQGDHMDVDVCSECKRAIVDLLENNGERGAPIVRGKIFPERKEHIAGPELPPPSPPPIISAPAEQKAPWWSRFFRRIFKWQTPN